MILSSLFLYHICIDKPTGIVSTKLDKREEKSRASPVDICRILDDGEIRALAKQNTCQIVAVTRISTLISTSHFENSSLRVSLNVIGS